LMNNPGWGYRPPFGETLLPSHLRLATLVRRTCSKSHFAFYFVSSRIISKPDNTCASLPFHREFTIVMIVSVLTNSDFRKCPRNLGWASLGVTIGTCSALVMALLTTNLEAADRHHKHRPAEIWHGSKLVVPSPPALEATDDDEVAQPAAQNLPDPAPFAFERLPPTLQELPPLRLPTRDQPIRPLSQKTSAGQTFEATIDPIGNHQLPAQWSRPGASAGRNSTAAIPQISVSGDSGYEINLQRGPQGISGSAAEQTAVKPISFHFTIEEKNADHRPSAPDRWQSPAELAVVSDPSQQKSNISGRDPADSNDGSAIRGSGVLLPIATFVLGLVCFPLIVGVAASVYLRRRGQNGPLFRVDLVNPAGGEQPYQVGLARVRLSAGPDAAETARQDAPSSSHRQGTVLDEPLPIAPIGPTYDEQKRQEEEQRQELEQAMLQEAFRQNIELRQQLATDSD